MDNRHHAAQFSHATPPRIGVLVTNLGSPDAPDPAALRRYLAQFLWDPRVVDVPRPLWWLILHGIILRTRPKRSAALYRKVWSEQGAPLLVTARRQAERLRERLANELEGPVEVALGMRYGNPSIGEALRQLRSANVQRLLILPLYPQYSCSTTASTFDAVAEELKGWRWMPELRMVTHYHDHPGYIDALANSIRDARQGREPAQQLLFSFHGTPRRFLEEGDPYYCECQKTARLVAEKLQLPDDSWRVTFQSRFGREEWLKPYTDETLQALPGEGVQSVEIICPGFSADCLETLEEIAGENHELFTAAGGKHFHYIPALNEREDHISALAQLTLQHLQGWAHGEETAESSESRSERARTLGASK